VRNAACALALIPASMRKGPVTGFIVTFAKGHSIAFSADEWFNIDPDTIVLTVFDGKGREYDFPPESWVRVDDDSAKTPWWNKRLA
jgi:hypothetical protein